jgi:hypothetical protein
VDFWPEVPAGVSPEGCLHKAIYLLRRVGRQTPSLAVCGEQRLGPHDEVDYPGVDAVRPIVQEDLVVVSSSISRHPASFQQLPGEVCTFASEGQLRLGLEAGPSETLPEHEVHDRAVLPIQHVAVPTVASKLGGETKEGIETAGG